MTLGWLLGAAWPASGLTLVVTNHADAGPGTLREAITTVNLVPGADGILFNLPSDAPRTITFLSALPEVTDPLFLDGRSQPDYDTRPVIELDGSQLFMANGISLRTTNATVRGLALTGFGGAGISIEGGGGHFIVDNVVGADPEGLAARGNAVGLEVVDAANNAIGGTLPEDGNIIAGNDTGILVTGASTGNLIQGNLVGLAADGRTALPNRVGVEIHADGNTVGGAEPGAGNAVSGNLDQGLVVEGVGNVIQGNLIGLDREGQLAVGNGLAGLWIVGGRNHTIGGVEPGAGNVISGNLGTGLDLSGSGHVVQGNIIGLNAAGTALAPNGTEESDAAVIVQGPWHTLGGAGAAGNVLSGNTGDGLVLRGEMTVSNVIQGNVVGLAAQGDAIMPNGRHGVVLEMGAGHNTLGGSGAGDGNILSGNRHHGLVLQSPNNVVQGNRIGVAANGVTPRGNGEHGMQFLSGATNNLVGGTEPGAGNLMAWNLGHGAMLCLNTNLGGNSLLGNLFHDNGGLAIHYFGCGPLSDPGFHMNPDTSGVFPGPGPFDLGTPYPNDPLDADMAEGGPQNHPVLTNVVALSGQAFLSGVLESRPIHDYLIEVYRNDAPDANSGFGEGRWFLDRFYVTTDTNGLAVFNRFMEGDPGLGFLSATATDAMTGDTSEFGPYVAMPGALRILGILRSVEGQTVITWTARPGKTYRLLGAPTLEGPFEEVGVISPATGRIASYIIPDVMQVTAQFYRVVEE